MLKVRNAMNGFVLGSSLLIASLAVSACTTDDLASDDDVTAEDGSIARLSLDTGTTVSFFEESPGMITISENAPIGVPSIFRADVSPIDLYASLAPGKELPAALVSAQRRSDALNGVAPTAASTDLGLGGIKITDQNFQNNYCSGTWDTKLCRLHKNANYSDPVRTVRQYHMVTCSNTGTVTMEYHLGSNPTHQHDLIGPSCLGWFGGPYATPVQTHFAIVNVNTSDDYDYSVRVDF